MLFLSNALKTLDLALFKGLKIQCCVTSPPYFGLRDYGNDAQIGLEQTVEEYIDNLVKFFAKVRKIMADDGVLWVNIAASLHGRKWAGCELNEDYVKIMQQRLNKEFEVLK